MLCRLCAYERDFVCVRAHTIPWLVCVRSYTASRPKSAGRQRNNSGGSDEKNSVALQATERKLIDTYGISPRDLRSLPLETAPAAARTLLTRLRQLTAERKQGEAAEAAADRVARRQRAAAAAAAAATAAAAAEEELGEFEKQRKRNMARNQELLIAMGLADGGAANLKGA